MARLFTSTQAAMLRHRLTVSDCIAEALERDVDEVDAACESVLGCLEHDDWVALNEIEEDVLDEAVAGSTYLAALEQDNISPQRWAGAQREFLAAAQKVANLIGRTIELPPEASQRYVHASKESR